MTKSGANLSPSSARIPTFTPSALASYDAATIQAYFASLTRRFVTPTGRPRNSGRACCSTVAKQEFRSICMTCASSRLSGSCTQLLLKALLGLIGNVNQFPVQRLSIKLQPVISFAVGHIKDMDHALAMRRGVAQAGLGECYPAIAVLHALWEALRVLLVLKVISDDCDIFVDHCYVFLHFQLLEKI